MLEILANLIEAIFDIENLRAASRQLAQRLFTGVIFFFRGFAGHRISTLRQNLFSDFPTL
jgi:hypothetical protein